MKEIKLSKFGKNKGKYIALVDDEDFEYLNQFNWHVHFGKTNTYAKRNVNIDGIRTSQCLHLLIMGDKMIDNIDHNGLNCQKANLRKCNNQQNGMNRRSVKPFTSKYKGVSWDKKRNLWRSQIQLSGKIIFLGRFNNEIEAAITYDKKAIELYGEFAFLNVR